jgi:hypothetical protein
MSRRTRTRSARRGLLRGWASWPRPPNHHPSCANPARYVRDKIRPIAITVAAPNPSARGRPRRPRVGGPRKPISLGLYPLDTRSRRHRRWIPGWIECRGDRRCDSRSCRDWIPEIPLPKHTYLPGSSVDEVRTQPPIAIVALHGDLAGTRVARKLLVVPCCNHCAGSPNRSVIPAQDTSMAPSASVGVIYSQIVPLAPGSPPANDSTTQVSKRWSAGLQAFDTPARTSRLFRDSRDRSSILSWYR